MAQLYYAERLPISYNLTGELVDLFKRQLELCNVQPGEHVLLHSFGDTYPHYPAAFMGAALALQADVFQIVHPRTPLRAVVSAWKQADLVIEMSSVPLDYTEIMKHALDAGTRVLRVAMEEEVLRRLAPNAEMRRRVEAGGDILRVGSEIHITSLAGTDITLNKTGRDAQALYSIADKPGRWDIWPSGIVCCAPQEDWGEGVLVVNRGDYIKQLRQYAHEPIYFEVRDGCIKSIKGGLEADLVTEYFDSYDDPNAYRISHVGWGCEKRASWLKPAQDIAVYYGNMEIAFGANFGIFPQGQTKSRAHIDFPCRHHSLWVDGQQVLDHGEFVMDTLKYNPDAS